MSSGYLVDTSVLSALAPGRALAEASLRAWLQDPQLELYVSAVTIAEIEQGVCKLRRAGGADRANALSQWLDDVIKRGGERILPVDARTARIAGALSDSALAAGRHPGFADVAIAATAIANGLHLLTRSGKHFEPLGVAFSDPSRHPSA